MAQAGDKFPEFTAQSHAGETVDVAQYRGGKNLVVFFYPKANTSG